MKKRQSAIELLRILAMLLIVAGHLLGQSGLLALHPTFVAHLVASASRLACNLFLLVGCWFLVEVDFKWSSVRRLYLTVFEYTSTLTILMLALGADASVKDILRGFLPFTGRALWFASAYLTLLLLTPWLRRVLSLPRDSLGGLVGVLMLAVCGVSTLPEAQMGYVVDCVWFVCVYLAVGWFKRAVANGRFPLAASRLARILSLLVGLVVYLALVFVSCRSDGFLGAWAHQCLADFKTLPNFLSAILVFNFFVNWDLGSVAVINNLARPAFAVYVIHQTPAFFPFLWTRICRVDIWADSPRWGLIAAGIVVGVYMAGWGIDGLRRGLFARIRRKGKRS